MTDRSDREQLPAHWRGIGTAPNCSVRVASAHEAIKDAQDRLLDALRAEYPRGKRVTVIHYRGHFCGYVVGWDTDGCRVVVKNERSLKVGKWWAAHVQLSEAQQ
jgi:hypothetical protein